MSSENKNVDVQLGNGWISIDITDDAIDEILKQHGKVDVDMGHLGIPLAPDEDGFIGRKCPIGTCTRYFKIASKAKSYRYDSVIQCPYCGGASSYSDFITKDQQEYAKVAFLSAIVPAIKSTVEKLNKQGSRLTFAGGDTPRSLPGYKEEDLETIVTCEKCKLRYAIYGVFAYCPNCGTHNSRQILDKNLELAEKELALAATLEGDLAEHLVGDALKNAVSAFDGFGRELCHVYSTRATHPAQAQNISFQNLAGAQRNINNLYGFDLAACLDASDWAFALRCFQKRHLLSHSMGVVDEKYMQATGDPQAVVGRKAVVHPDDVRALITLLRNMGTHLVTQFAGLATAGTP